MTTTTPTTTGGDPPGRTMNATTAAHVGSLLLHKQVTLSADELADLLCAATARQANYTKPVDDADRTLAELWQALVTADPEAAEAAFADAQTMADPTSLVSLAELFATTTDTTQEIR